MPPKDLDLSAAAAARETCLCISPQSSPADIAACPKARRWNSPLSKARKAGRRRTLKHCRTHHCPERLQTRGAASIVWTQITRTEHLEARLPIRSEERRVGKECRSRW